MGSRSEFVPLTEAWNEKDVALIHSTLKPTGIDYFISEEAVSAKIGMGRRRLMVERARADEARGLIDSSRRRRLF